MDEVDDERGGARPERVGSHGGSRAAAPSSSHASRSSDGEREPPRKKRRRTRRKGRRTAAAGEVAKATAGVSDASASKRRRTKKRPRPDLYAALDLGTNNCRLLVARPARDREIQVVDSFSRIVRLGEGLGATGELAGAAMDRAVDALKVCASKIRSKQLRGVRLIATEACRRAGNGQSFLDRIQSETGLELEIVNRETEARLSVSGCGGLVDKRAKGAVLFDIGGGSSELSLLEIGRRRRRRGKKGDRARGGARPRMAAWTSLPLGVVTLSEKHGGGRDVTRAIFDDMVEDVMEHIGRFEKRDAIRDAVESENIHLLGTSGTVTTLAGVHLKLPRYDRRRVDGIWMGTKDIDRVIDDLLEMTFEERMGNPCIGRDRADLVLAGCAILVAIRRTWPCDRLRVADRGLREGILNELMQADGAWARLAQRGAQGGAQGGAQHEAKA